MRYSLCSFRLCFLNVYPSRFEQNETLHLRSRSCSQLDVLHTTDGQDFILELNGYAAFVYIFSFGTIIVARFDHVVVVVVLL